MADLPEHQLPRILPAGIAIDDRGTLSFANALDLSGVKRFYCVSNHRVGFVRAWHGHRAEAKYVFPLRGAMLVAAVHVDDWESPSPDLPVHRFTLSANQPQVLHIPPGHANGSMSLTPDAQLIFFSTSTVEESRADDIRFHARYWDPWHVDER